MSRNYVEKLTKCIDHCENEIHAFEHISNVGRFSIPQRTRFVTRLISCAELGCITCVHVCLCVTLRLIGKTEFGTVSRESTQTGRKNIQRIGKLWSLLCKSNWGEVTGFVFTSAAIRKSFENISLWLVVLLRRRQTISGNS